MLLSTVFFKRECIFWVKLANPATRVARKIQTKVKTRRHCRITVFLEPQLACLEIFFPNKTRDTDRGSSLRRASQDSDRMATNVYFSRSIEMGVVQSGLVTSWQTEEDITERWMMYQSLINDCFGGNL